MSTKSTPSTLSTAPRKNKPMTTPEPLIPKHGGYRNLKSFQVAQLVYDVTVRFADKYTTGAAAPTTR